MWTAVCPVILLSRITIPDKIWESMAVNSSKKWLARWHSRSFLSLLSYLALFFFIHFLQCFLSTSIVQGCRISTHHMWLSEVRRGFVEKPEWGHEKGFKGGRLSPSKLSCEPIHELAAFRKFISTISRNAVSSGNRLRKCSRSQMKAVSWHGCANRSAILHTQPPDTALASPCDSPLEPP